MADSFSDDAVLIDIAFVTSFTINIGAGIHRIAEHVIDGDVGRCDPTKLLAVSESRHHPQRVLRKGQVFRTEPQPDLACRAQFGELGQDRAEAAANRFVRVKTDFAFPFPPYQSDGQGATQFPACRFVTDSAVESLAKDV